jgi:hypothetical protein
MNPTRLLVPAPVVAEIDQPLGVRLGRDARALFYSSAARRTGASA